MLKHHKEKKKTLKLQHKSLKLQNCRGGGELNGKVKTRKNVSYTFKKEL